MADKEEKEEKVENAPRGNEWEVVSLTASAYAAAPGPEEIELKDDNQIYGGDEAQTSRALFMSGHFVFPPSQHENLPLEPDKSEIYDAEGGKDVVSDLDAVEEGKSSGKATENLDFQDLSVPDKFPGEQFFDEKVNMSIHGADFEETITQQGSLHSETGLSGSTIFGGSTTSLGQIESSEQGLSYSPELSETPSLDDKDCRSDLPCGAWWKRSAASLYAHAKEANTFWSIFIAAAVMGLVILGQQWQQERWQTMQLKWHVSFNDQKPSRLMGHITRLKDVIGGGQRRGSFVKGSSTDI